MSEAEIIEMLTGRLDRIQTAVDEINVYLRDHPACPRPGLCLDVAADLATERADRKVLEARTRKLETWQAWLTGIFAAAIPIATLFGPAIRKALGLD